MYIINFTLGRLPFVCEFEITVHPERNSNREKLPDGFESYFWEKHYLFNYSLVFFLYCFFFLGFLAIQQLSGKV